MIRATTALEIPVDPSVTEGRCYFCGDPVVVPATAGRDFVGGPVPAAEMPEHPVLVRMCDDCRHDFEEWRRDADRRLSLAPGDPRRTDA